MALGNGDVIIPTSRGYTDIKPVIYSFTNDNGVKRFDWTFFGVNVEKGSKEGFCNTNGKEIVPCLYYDCRPCVYFMDGTLVGYEVRKSSDFNSTGLYDLQGKQIIPFEFYDITPAFNDDTHTLSGFEVATDDFEVRAFYSTSGKLIIPKNRNYSWIIQKYLNGRLFFVVQKGGKDDMPFHSPQGLCDTDGKEIVPPTYYSSASVFNCEKGDFLVLSHPSSSSIFNSSGEEVLSLDGKNYIDMHYDKGKFWFGYCSDGKYGVCDATGKTIISPKYDRGLGYNQSTGKFYYWDKDKKKVPVDVTLSSFSSKQFTSGLIESIYNPSKPKINLGNNSKSSGSDESKPKVNLGGNNSSSQTSTSTVVVEHHRDPIPVQVWVACPACALPGQCPYCGGTGWAPNGKDRCYSCHGSGKCTLCNGTGGHYEVQYR